MKSHRKFAAWIGGSLWCACAIAWPAATLAGPSRPLSEAAQLVPLVDHHQHLTSPLSVRALDPPALAVVELPPPLAALLRERAKRWKDPDAMRELYTPDALVLSIRFPSWVEGDRQGAWAMGWLAGPLFSPYRLTPVWHRSDGTVARIAGYYTDDQRNPGRQIGFFQMTAEQGADGEWRIATEMPAFPARQSPTAFDAADLVAMLDDAGIHKAVVLSNAYSFDGLVPAPGDARRNVRRENEWTAEQVMRFPERLVGFCSFNPTADHASDELAYCARDPAFKGVKLHLGTSPVDLDNPAHVAATRRIFEAVNELRLPILVHLTASLEWGRRQARIFLDQLVAAAPDVQVVVAHLWGGAGYNEAALATLADAVASGNPAAANLYFEVAQVAEVARGHPQTLHAITAHMRTIGLERIYYGSDGPQPPGVPPRESWARFRDDIPLDEAELAIIANNVAPWAQ